VAFTTRAAPQPPRGRGDRQANRAAENGSRVVRTRWTAGRRRTPAAIVDSNPLRQKG